MRRYLLMTVSVLLLGLLTGCVSQSQSTELLARQQTISEMTSSNNQLQSEIATLKAQQSQESLKLYRAKVSEIYGSLENNYNNFVAQRSSSTTTNLMTGETIPSNDPVLSSTDKELLAIWRTALIKLSQLMEN